MGMKAGAREMVRRGRVERSYRYAGRTTFSAGAVLDRDAGSEGAGDSAALL